MNSIKKTTAYYGSFDKNKYAGIDVPIAPDLLQPFLKKFKVALEEIRAKKQFCFGVFFDVRLNSTHHHSNFPHNLYWPITLGMHSFIEGNPVNDDVVTSRRVSLNDMEIPEVSLAILFHDKTSEPFTEDDNRERFFEEHIVPIQHIVENILAELEQAKEDL